MNKKLLVLSSVLVSGIAMADADVKPAGEYQFLKIHERGKEISDALERHVVASNMVPRNNIAEDIATEFYRHDDRVARSDTWIPNKALVSKGSTNVMQLDLDKEDGSKEIKEARIIKLQENPEVLYLFQVSLEDNRENLNHTLSECQEALKNRSSDVRFIGITREKGLLTFSGIFALSKQRDAEIQQILQAAKKARHDNVAVSAAKARHDAYVAVSAALENN